MKNQTRLSLVSRSFLACAFAVIPLAACHAEASSEWRGFIQIGEMQQVIGEGQAQGRVDLAEIVGMPRFYGIGALEDLRGEITILDSGAIVTGVTPEGRPKPTENPAAKAAMLAGQQIRNWKEIKMTEAVPPEQFDKTIGRMAAGRGIDISKPFVFVVEGAFRDLRLHVINGACPIRARMKKIDIEEDKQPAELEMEAVTGTIVGVYAADSVGKLTHPATSTHAHLIYLDEDTGARLTGHIEQVGLVADTVLKLPEPGEERDSTE